jgi:uncharacterized membrane protein (Fun14 family)
MEESNKNSSCDSWIISSWIAYLQYYQIATVNWNKLQTISEDVIPTLSNLTMQIPGVGSTSDGHAVAASLVMTNFDIPLTGSMSAGFAIGFMKG